MLVMYVFFAVAERKFNKTFLVSETDFKIILLRKKHFKILFKTNRDNIFLTKLCNRRRSREDHFHKLWSERFTGEFLCICATCFYQNG